jgi:hypothetical protein
VSERQTAAVGRAAVGRRGALRLLAGLALGALPLARLGAAPLVRARWGPEHPEPRPGITAERVLPADVVPSQARKAYEAAREIPQVLDGLYCHCGCAARDGLRSLLSCFETRMPFSCGYCREEAELALRLHRDGRTLAEIRRAVDREYGD